MANSKLGATMTAYILYGSLDSWLSKGNPKAAVFPEPVYELIMTLCCWSMEGIARACMLVGV